MSEYAMIFWTCGSIEEARRVGRYLVQERLVACVSIIPWVESIFLWNDKVDTEQESKVMLKTRRDNFEAVKQVILDNTSYEVPEITLVSIDEAHHPYLDWMESTIKTANPL